MSIASPSGTFRELHDLTNGLNGLQLSPNGAAPTSTPSIDDQELERFRREWQKEVQAKKGKEREVDVGPVRWKGKEPDATPNIEAAQPVSRAQPSLTSARSPSRSPASPIRPLREVRTSPRSPTRPLRPPGGDETAAATAILASSPPSTATSALPRATIGGRRLGRASRENRREEAVAIYAQAVEHEQSGQLNEALMLYRQAFKLDDNVDRLYTLHRPRQVYEPVIHSSTDLVSASPPHDEPYSFQRHIQTDPDYQSHSARQQTKRISPLTNLLQHASVPIGEAAFLPADENLPIPIATLPAEVLGHILTHLDVASLERLGATCWRARYLSAHSQRWKTLCEGIYIPPAIVPRDDVRYGVKELGKGYGGEWRTMLIEEDRVRMDGCYIAVCHYIRPGAGDEWVAVTHMITYHRFLRFYPDGTVISYLTTDHPSEVVPRLKPSLRSKGLHIGRYQLIRDHPASDHRSHKTRIVITDLLEPGSMDPKYEFEMELSLRATGRGRWNKLDILDYRSINLATGESLGLVLKHQKPFYFSKVRSYHPSL